MSTKETDSQPKLGDSKRSKGNALKLMFSRFALEIHHEKWEKIEAINNMFVHKFRHRVFFSQ